MADLSWTRILARTLTSRAGQAGDGPLRGAVVVVRDDHLGQMSRYLDWVDRTMSSSGPTYARRSATAESTSGRTSPCRAARAALSGGSNTRCAPTLAPWPCMVHDRSAGVRPARPVLAHTPLEALATSPPWHNAVIRLRGGDGDPAQEISFPVGDGGNASDWMAGRGGKFRRSTSRSTAESSRGRTPSRSRSSPRRVPRRRSAATGARPWPPRGWSLSHPQDPLSDGWPACRPRRSGAPTHSWRNRRVSVPSAMGEHALGLPVGWRTVGWLSPAGRCWRAADAAGRCWSTLSSSLSRAWSAACERRPPTEPRWVAFTSFSKRDGVELAAVTTGGFASNVLEQFYTWLVRIYGRDDRFTVVTYVAGVRAFFRFPSPPSDVTARAAVRGAARQPPRRDGSGDATTPRIDRRLPLIVTHVDGLEIRWRASTGRRLGWRSCGTRR